MVTAGKWVVSFQWILDSLSRGLACDEHDYEVNDEIRPNFYIKK